MTRGTGENIFFVLYLIIVLLLTVIYFTVPERASFFENQLKWWGEFWKVVSS